MPDPFDIYSGERPTFGSNIRWGLSGDSLASSLVPDLALVGAGSLLSTYGLRRQLGRPLITPGAAKWSNLWLGGLAKTRAEETILKRAIHTTRPTISPLTSPLRTNKLVRAGNIIKTLGLWYGVAQLSTGVASMARSIGNAVNEAQPRGNIRPPSQFATTFYDTSGAYTMRQRAMAAIHNSQLSTRASLGNEASFMHS